MNAELKLDISAPPSVPEIALENAALRAELTHRLRAIKIGSFTVDNGSHQKHFPVAAVCLEAASEIERANEHERQLKGECLMLVDVLRDAFEVIKTVEGEDSDECDKLSDLHMSIEYALALYDYSSADRVVEQ